MKLFHDSKTQNFHKHDFSTQPKNFDRVLRFPVAINWTPNFVKSAIQKCTVNFMRIQIENNDPCPLMNLWNGDHFSTNKTLVYRSFWVRGFKIDGYTLKLLLIKNKRWWQSNWVYLHLFNEVLNVCLVVTYFRDLPIPLWLTKTRIEVFESSKKRKTSSKETEMRLDPQIFTESSES